MATSVPPDLFSKLATLTSDFLKSSRIGSAPEREIPREEKRTNEAALAREGMTEWKIANEYILVREC